MLHHSWNSHYLSKSRAIVHSTNSKQINFHLSIERNDQLDQSQKLFPDLELCRCTDVTNRTHLRNGEFIVLRPSLKSVDYAKHLNLNSLSILYKIWMLLMRRLWIDSSWVLAVSLYFLHLASSDVWHKEGGIILLSAMDKRKSLFQMYTISWGCMLRRTLCSLFLFLFQSLKHTHTCLL